ncbi:MAG: galactokinase [Chloroflexi bacterium]|nr:galactokinase [Chloroflexota bacterium]
MAVDPAAVRVVRAPGRINLIGEHTDYNDGFVLPAAIDLETRIAFVPTTDRRVGLAAEGEATAASIDLDAIGTRAGAWADYIAGTAWALAAAGVPTRGLTGLVTSTLPREAGLSSSAALELAAAWALADGDAPPLDGLALARACQRAENDYVGVQCGLMDQFAVSCGVAGAALLLDCRSLAFRPVPLPEERLALVVCHTGARRRLGASAYNDRRRQCAEAVAAVARHRRDVASLRDLGVADLPWLATILDEVGLRRARHVITENDRVLATVAALAAGEDERVGELFAASHASLRDDFEVSSRELDLLVAIATATPGVGAARMTGGGFGGCTVNLVRPDAVERLASAVLRDYPARTGLQPAVMAVRAADGAGIVTRG